MCPTRLRVLAALSRKLRSALGVVDVMGKGFPPPKLFWPSFPSHCLNPMQGKLGQGKSCASLISQSRSLRRLPTGDLLPLPPYSQASCRAGLVLEASVLEEREDSRAEQAPPLPPLSAYKTLELALTSQWFLGDTRQSSSSVTASAPDFSSSHHRQSWTLGFCYCQKDDV